MNRSWGLLPIIALTLLTLYALFVEAGNAQVPDESTQTRARWLTPPERRAAAELSEVPRELAPPHLTATYLREDRGWTEKENIVLLQERYDVEMVVYLLTPTTTITTTSPATSTSTSTPTETTSPSPTPTITHKPITATPSNTPLTTIPTPTPTPSPTFTPSATETTTPTQGPVIYCSQPNLTIPDNNPNGIVDSLHISDTTSINDLSLYIAASHSWVGDLSFQLRHSSGISTTVINRPGHPATKYGCSGDNIDVLLDDYAGSPVEETCASSIPTLNGSLSPTQPLSLFRGHPFSGFWELVGSDHVDGDIGILQGWCLIEWSPNPTPTLPSNIYLSFISNAATPTATATATPSSCLSYEIEPNNTRADANSNRLLCFGTTIWGSLPPGDNDLFRVEVTDETHSSFQLTNVPSSSNYDLYLYDAELAPIAGSANDGNADEQIIRSLTPGTYYLRVHLRQGGSFGLYDLSWN